MPGDTGANGYVRWRDLEEHSRVAREELQEERHRLERRIEKVESVSASAGKLIESRAQHEVGLARAIHQGQEQRLNDVEAVLDQQRGAKNLVYALIGSNVLLAVLSLLTILHVMGLIG